MKTQHINKCECIKNNTEENEEQNKFYFIIKVVFSTIILVQPYWRPMI